MPSKPAPGVDRVLRRARSPPVGRPRLGGIERHERGHGVRGLERELEFRRAWDRAAVVRDRQQRHDQPRVARRGLGKSHRLELPAHRTVPSGPIRHGTPALFEGDDLGRVGGRGIHEPGIGAGETARVELPASGLSRRPFDRRPHADHPLAVVEIPGRRDLERPRGARPHQRRGRVTVGFRDRVGVEGSRGVAPGGGGTAGGDDEEVNHPCGREPGGPAFRHRRAVAWSASARERWKSGAGRIRDTHGKAC